MRLLTRNDKIKTDKKGDKKMVCKVCGASNVDHAKYCAVCGALLEPDKKRKKRGISHPNLLLVLGAVLAGCIYGIGLSLYLL